MILLHAGDVNVIVRVTIVRDENAASVITGELDFISVDGADRS